MECIYAEEKKEGQKNKKTTFFQVVLEIIYMEIYYMAKDGL